MDLRVIEDLVRYIENHEEPRELKNISISLSDVRFRVACINLLEWLAIKNRVQNKNPLSLRQKYPWQEDLIYIIDNLSDLNCLFEVKNCALDFKPEIAEENRMLIRSFVDKGLSKKMRR